VVGWGRIKSIVVFLYYNSVCSQEDLNIDSSFFLVAFMTMEKQVEPSFCSCFFFLFSFFCSPFCDMKVKTDALYHLCNIVLFLCLSLCCERLFLCFIKFMTGN